MAMDPRQAAAEADALASKRGMMMIGMGLLYLSQQFVYFGGDGRVSTVKAILWGVLTIVMLLILLTRGHLGSPREVRERLEDEFTRANRAKGLAAGFVAAMTAAIGCFYWAVGNELGARDAVHIIVSAGLAVALIRFGWLEHRANADE